MSKQNDGGPAFPRHGYFNHEDLSGESNTVPQSGMSMRDYFAGQALAGGLMDLPTPGELPPGITTADVAANIAYRMADAMIAARNKEATE